jgi:catechol 2,3-dioxygenase-like lactoylglutathione lyase family enzyme
MSVKLASASNDKFLNTKENTTMPKPRLQHVSTLVPPGSQEAVRAFYGELLGLEEKQPPSTLNHLQLVWFAAGEGEMELHFLPSTDRPRDYGQHFCLVVDDIEAYRRKLTEAGIDITEAEPIPGRPRLFCHDPFGNLVELTTILGDYRTYNE